MTEMVMGLYPRSLTNGVGCPWLGFTGGLLPGAWLAQTGLEWTWQPQTPGASSSQEEFHPPPPSVVFRLLAEIDFFLS